MAKKYRPFKEKYKYLNDIQTLYTYADDAHLKTKSKWEYTTDNVSPKTHAIAQHVVVSCNPDLEKPEGSCLATQLEVKYKLYYDFKFVFSFKAIDFGNWIGVLFRK